MNRAVKRGVKVLDRRGPENWFLRVDPSTLDLADQRYCVVGQVYGGAYGYGLRELGIRFEGGYGFLPGRGRVKAWGEIISTRRRRYLDRFPVFSLESLYNEELSEEDRKAYSLID